MWYFSWVLGLSLACAFAVLNALWLELAPTGDDKEDR
ncbi:MAG: cytochrome bd-I oxidase subunit CydX [Alphaproteobacteria bacterium]